MTLAGGVLSASEVSGLWIGKTAGSWRWGFNIGCELPCFARTKLDVCLKLSTMNLPVFSGNDLRMASSSLDDKASLGAGKPHISEGNLNGA